MRKTLATLAAAAITATSLATLPAHAADPGPEIWSKAWAVEGPGASLTEATVRVQDCHTIEVIEKRTDRASRAVRVEGDFPNPSGVAHYPDTEHMIIPLTTDREGQWTMVYGWTHAHGDLDWERVVFVPKCSEDRNPQTYGR